VEISQLKAERQRIQGSAAASEARAEELASDLEGAKQVEGRAGAQGVTRRWADGAILIMIICRFGLVPS
jgi:hypothetical protein